MNRPRGYDEHREDERKNARAWCEKDVSGFFGCSCDNTAPKEPTDITYGASHISKPYPPGTVVAGGPWYVPPDGSVKK